MCDFLIRYSFLVPQSQMDPNIHRCLSNIWVCTYITYIRYKHILTSIHMSKLIYIDVYLTFWYVHT
jgi:hypothetical protein